MMVWRSAATVSSESHLSYLPDGQRSDVVSFLNSYPCIGDVPFWTTELSYDVDFGSAAPIKQHAYCCPIPKREVMNK